MDEKKEKKGHRITIENRSGGTVSGVLDVLSFDTQEIRLETEQGKLTVKGDGLHICRISLEQGEADLEGRIDSLNYSGGGSKGAGNPSIWRRIFQ